MGIFTISPSEMNSGCFWIKIKWRPENYDFLENILVLVILVKSEKCMADLYKRKDHKYNQQNNAGHPFISQSGKWSF